MGKENKSHVIILGRRNTGKSSLINALTGQEVAIVSDHPQTTRNKLLGVATGEDWQIVFVDTPGLNDDERMTRITEEIIPKLDVVIMVLVPDNPFSISEADFVLNKLMTSDLGRLLFLVNKIDLVRPRDRARVVESIRAKIQSSVLEKSKDVYGADGTKYVGCFVGAHGQYGEPFFIFTLGTDSETQKDTLIGKILFMQTVIATEKITKPSKS